MKLFHQWRVFSSLNRMSPPLHTNPEGCPQCWWATQGTKVPTAWDYIENVVLILSQSPIRLYSHSTHLAWISLTWKCNLIYTSRCRSINTVVCSVRDMCVLVYSHLYRGSFAYYTCTYWGFPLSLNTEFTFLTRSTHHHKSTSVWFPKTIYCNLGPTCTVQYSVHILITKPSSELFSHVST